MRKQNSILLVAATLAVFFSVECRARADCAGAFDCKGDGTECAPRKDCCTRNMAEAAARCKAMGCACDSCAGTNSCSAIDKLQDTVRGKQDGLGDLGSGDAADGKTAGGQQLGTPITQQRNGFTVENDNSSLGNTSEDSSHQDQTASGLHSDLVNGVVIDPRNSNGVKLGDYGVMTNNVTGEQVPVVAYDTHPGRGNSVSEISNGLQQTMTGVDNSNQSVNGNYTVQMYRGSGQTFNNGQSVQHLNDAQVNANMGRFFRSYVGGKQ